jgi:hypothetical protein
MIAAPDYRRYRIEGMARMTKGADGLVILADGLLTKP